MAKNRLGIDWEIELPKQVLEYLDRCSITLTKFQEEQLSRMIVNGLKQNEDRYK